MYCARGMMIDDSDNGAIEAKISKLSIIYNNSQRAHTSIRTAQNEISVCQSSFSFDLRSSVVYLMENSKLTSIKSIASKKEQYDKYKVSVKKEQPSSSSLEKAGGPHNINNC